MEHLNRIELRGVVGTVRPQVVNGTKMSRFSVATSRAYKDREGVAQIDTTWHNIVAWDSDKKIWIRSKADRRSMSWEGYILKSM